MSIVIEGGVQIGGNIGTIGTYVDSYTTAGTYTWTAPANLLYAEVLIIAGGGSGARIATVSGSSRKGAGGGAGGYIAQDVTSSITSGNNYTIVVGPGANVSILAGGYGSVDGGDSAAFGLTAIGGGGGGSSTTANSYGHYGGSGGGGGGGSGTAPNFNSDGYRFSTFGGNAVSGQGYAGGTSITYNTTNPGGATTVHAVGGGGGAGGPAGDTTPSTTTPTPNPSGTYFTGTWTGPPYTTYTGLNTGGIGRYSTITGANVYYAVGGDGGTWSGNSTTLPTTIGGGGAGSSNSVYIAQSGHDGCVIIKYQVY